MEIVRYSEDHMGDVAALFADRNLEFSEENIRWKLARVENTGWLVYDAGAARAYTSVLAADVPGLDHVGLLIDTISSKSHSRLDQLQALLNHAEAESFAAGYETLIGIPTDAMAAILKYLGWSALDVLHRYDSVEGLSATDALRVVDLPTAMKEHGDMLGTSAFAKWRWSRAVPYAAVVDDESLAGVLVRSPGANRELCVWVRDGVSLAALAGMRAFSIALNPESDLVAAGLRQRVIEDRGGIEVIARIQDAGRAAVASGRVRLGYHHIESLSLGW